MLGESIQKCLARLLLTFSDLCETDQEIAECMTFMRIQAPAGERQWTQENVRSLMPQAYSTVCTSSDYAAITPNQATTAYCKAVAKIIRERKES